MSPRGCTSSTSRAGGKGCCFARTWFWNFRRWYHFLSGPELRRSRRDGDPQTEGLIDAVAPAVFLGANMTMEDTYFALYVFTMLAIASILGPSLGWALTKAAERSWTAVFEIAKIVEAGGLVLKDKERRDPTRKAEKLAAIEKRRADRFRQAGSAIPDDMWRHGSNSEVMEALDDHFDVPPCNACYSTTRTRTTA